jgi:FAD binding domain
VQNLVDGRDDHLGGAVDGLRDRAGRIAERGGDLRRGQASQHLGVILRAGQDVLVADVQEGESPEGPAVVRAAYAVGCDGAASVVRAAAGIDFEGTPDTWRTILGDIELTAPALTLNQPGGSMYMVAIGGGRYRLAVIDHATLEAAASPVKAGFPGCLDVVTAELAGDHPEWAGVRALLIRPDGHVAWATRGDDVPPLDTWLGHLTPGPRR